ncbi:hypothetical protein SSX86_025576 [Deinandra increscens subsp. villosa]|uniref:Uncharacterized protein n=1 Tax=Deinandra increscens subsp. villosa TaxID=3103831 RepID=A0AAP0CGH6_9ASTR
MGENIMSESTRRRNDQNSSAASDSIMLFGVRVKVDPMRKSVSMNDLTHYIHAPPAATVAADDSGYASADDALRHRSNSGRDRKRGVPWREDEHKLFLLGLQKVGKGDWRGIARNFVKTRTPTQVASHAQKYFLRRSNLNHRRRRSSLFDITTDSVDVISMEEEQAHEDNDLQPPMQLSHQTSPLSGFPMGTVGPVPSPSTIKNQMETVTVNYCDKFSLSTRAENDLDLDRDQKHESNSLSLSLSLNHSPSCDHNNGMDSSAWNAVFGFNNGEGITSVG